MILTSMAVPVGKADRVKTSLLLKGHVSKEEVPWKNVAFTGVSEFYISGSGGRKLIRRKANEELCSRNIRSTM